MEGVGVTGVPPPAVELLPPPPPQPAKPQSTAATRTHADKLRKIMAILSRLIYSLLMHLLHKSLIVAIALLGLQSAHAEWKIIGNFPAGDYYIESDSIEKKGAIRDFWTMLDYPTAQKSARGATYLSTRTHMQLDCKKQSVLILQFSMHAGRKLTGELIDQQGVMRDWQSIPPDTPLVKIAQMVC